MSEEGKANIKTKWSHTLRIYIRSVWSLVSGLFWRRRRRRKKNSIAWSIRLVIITTTFGMEIYQTQTLEYSDETNDNVTQPHTQFISCLMSHSGAADIGRGAIGRNAARYVTLGDRIFAEFKITLFSETFTLSTSKDWKRKYFLWIYQIHLGYFSAWSDVCWLSLTIRRFCVCVWCFCFLFVCQPKWISTLFTCAVFQQNWKKY